MLGFVSYVLFAIIMLSIIVASVILVYGLYIRFKKK